METWRTALLDPEGRSISIREGDLCKFRYLQQSGNYRWYRWSCTAVFLGRTINGPVDQLSLSFRPKGGTSQMPTSYVTDVVVIKPMHERRYRGGHDDDERLVKLPKREPGAVPAPGEGRL